MFFKMFTTFCFLFLSFSQYHVFSGTTDPQTPDHKYINYGKDFTYVVKLSGQYKDGKNFGASAVIIDEHHILTAGHVVEDIESCFVNTDNGEKFCIEEMIVHENFNSNNFGFADIAIGYSSRSFNLAFYPSLYEKEDEEGKICSIAGYGFHGTFNTGAKLYDGKRRAGSNIIDTIQKNLLICSPSKPGEINVTSLEFLINSGDSGGGLFIGNELAGINSCIMRVDGSPSGKYNEESGHTRISQFVEWINKHKRR